LDQGAAERHVERIGGIGTVEREPGDRALALEQQRRGAHRGAIRIAPSRRITSALRSKIVTFAPPAASIRDVSPPGPGAPPVTIAAIPFRSICPVLPQTSSTAKAVASPPPMHRLATPRLRPRFCKAASRVAITRAPL